MSKSQSPKLLQLILMMVLVLATVGLVWFLVASINHTLNMVDSTLGPIQQTNRDLSTQVASLLHPTPTVIPDPVTIIDKVRAVARLETIHYTVEKVITAEVNQGILGPLFGDKLLFVAHGYVIAGIDMSKMVPKDLWLEDGVLHVRLPGVEILVATLDNQKSYVYDRETGAFTHGNPDLETAARQVAEEEIRKAALNDGILDQAQINARVYLERFFQSLGYQTVTFETPNP
jgi:hypothetical protein